MLAGLHGCGPGRLKAQRIIEIGGMDEQVVVLELESFGRRKRGDVPGLLRS